MLEIMWAKFGVKHNAQVDSFQKAPIVQHLIKKKNLTDFQHSRHLEYLPRFFYKMTNKRDFLYMHSFKIELTQHFLWMLCLFLMKLLYQIRAPIQNLSRQQMMWSVEIAEEKLYPIKTNSKEWHGESTLYLCSLGCITFF